MKTIFTSTLQMFRKIDFDATGKILRHSNFISFILKYKKMTNNEDGNLKYIGNITADSYQVLVCSFRWRDCFDVLNVVFIKDIDTMTKNSNSNNNAF